MTDASASSSSSTPSFAYPPPFDSTAQLMDRVTAQLNAQLARVAPPRHRAAPPTLVAVAHGSRDPAATRTVRALLDLVRELRPHVPVRLAHIELAAPLLDDTLAAVRGPAVLVPLLLGRGHHVKKDLPAAVARAPHLSARIAEPLGPHPLLATALHGRLAEAGLRRAARTGVVLAAAGSRDPDSLADTDRCAALLSNRLGGLPVVPAYASAGGRTVTEAVALLTSRGCHRVAVAGYFTAPGRFAAQVAASAPWIASAPLGAHPAMARLVVERYERAVRGAAESEVLRASA